MSGWLPIKTAPKDGTAVLLYRAETGRWIGKFRPLETVWRVVGAADDKPDQKWVPIHWMPLPAPPVQS